MYFEQLNKFAYRQMNDRGIIEAAMTSFAASLDIRCHEINVFYIQKDPFRQGIERGQSKKTKNTNKNKNDKTKLWQLPEGTLESAIVCVLYVWFDWS